MINSMLPDDPDSKVNTCVDNVYRIWEEHADTKAAQLVFCDLSTPKNDGTFNVYDDMREKLIRRGIPVEQVHFIHEATTDAQKKELFARVRSGEVRILFGSTPKMGAGTNVQDRLIAIHHLDCPWRPSDLEQRQGRIERQENMFPEVQGYRYVTDQTFDAYLYQLVESKQKFISQIMTSKSPVCFAEDVDAHDFEALRAAFKEARETKGMPTAIILKSVKGKGVSFMENKAGWHGKAPNDEEYAIAMDELEKAGEALCQK